MMLREARKRKLEAQDVSWEDEPSASSDSGELQEPCYSSDEDSREWELGEPIERFGRQSGLGRTSGRARCDPCSPDAAGRGRVSISWTGALEARFLKALQQAGGVWVSALQMSHLVHALSCESQVSGSGYCSRAPGRVPRTYQWGGLGCSGAG